MKKITKCLFAAALGLLMSAPAYSQKNANSGTSTKTQRVTKEVNGCNYDVLSGLAEVISIDKIVNADKSPLGYDEYDVKFRFIPMEGGDLMASLRDMEIPLQLKYKQYQLRVGPEYLKAYHVRVGLKYAMKLLQNRTGDCAEKYICESGGLPNDLFEAREKLPAFEEHYYAQKLGAKEEAVANNEFNNTTNPNNIPDAGNPNDPNYRSKIDSIRAANPTSKEDPVVPNTTDNTNPNAVVQPSTNTNPENPGETGDSGDSTSENPGGNVDTTGISTGNNTNTSDVDEAAIRAQLQKELEEQIRKEMEAEKIKKQQEEEAARKAKEEEDRKNAIKAAKEKAKEDERKAKEEAERKRLEEEQRKAKEEALKAQIRAELEAKIREEARQKELEEAQRKADEERKRLEEEKEKQAALAREESMRKAREDEAKRATCAYGDKIAGTIEILETKKVKEENESIFGYAEYLVMVRFTPSNIEDIPKKDRGIWEQSYSFVLDPKGKSANPGARYIRQFNVFKGAKFKGFAQQLQGGICSQLMMFSPDLPSDVSQVKP